MNDLLDYLVGIFVYQLNDEEPHERRRRSSRVRGDLVNVM